MWTCERWPTLSGRCQVRGHCDSRFWRAAGPQSPKFVSPPPLLSLLHFLIDHPSLAFCSLTTDWLLEPRWKPTAVHCVGGTADLLLVIPRTLW